MKVLIVTSSFPNKYSRTKGLYNFYRAKELVSQGIDVEVILLNVCVSRSLNVKYCSRYNVRDLNIDAQCDINVTVINYIRVPFLYKIILDYLIQGFAKKMRPDIVHFQFLWSVFGHKKLRRSNIPYIVTCHGSDIHQLPVKSKSQIEYNLECLSLATHVIFVSNFLNNVAKQLGFNSENYSVINNGINIQKFKYNKKEAKQQFNVGYFGNLIPIKRVHLLPEIFYKVKQKIENIRFMICGGGSEFESIKNKISQLNIDVSFFSRFEHKELVEYLKLVDVIVMPSKCEGFPCIPLEARAMGVPTVGSNNGGLPESIGEFGRVIDDGPNMIEEFVEAIIDLLQNPVDADDLVESAKQQSWENIVKKEIDIYQKYAKKQ